MRYADLMIEAFHPQVKKRERKLRPNAADLAEIRKVRHQIRCEEGNGGQCGFVVEYCAARFGWQGISGTYCNDKDEPICVGHVWCLLPDNAIFDPTADQLGMGHDMRIIEPSDPDYKKYRFEWDRDFNPDLADKYPELKGVPWSGKDDVEWANLLRQERGDDWHVTDPKQYKQYQRQAAAYRSWSANPKKPF